MATDFYEEMRDVARELLAPTSKGGLGQGSIELIRYIEGSEQVDPWSPPAPPEREITVLDGAARGVGKELVGTPVDAGGQIVATDLQVIVAPWGGEYEPGNVLELDGSPVTVLAVRKLPAVGITCAVRFVVRR